MAQVFTLQALADDLRRRGVEIAREHINALLLSADEDRRVEGWLLKACDLFSRGLEPSALECLRQARRQLGFAPLPVIANIIWLSARSGLEQVAAHECLAFAEYAVENEYWDLALEALAVAFFFDTRGAFELIRSPAQSLKAASLYEKAAAALKPRLPPPPDKPRAAGKVLGVAMVVPNLVDDVVAYTKRVLYFARHADRSRYRLSVYSTENSAARDSHCFPYGPVRYRTEQTGRKTLAELRGLGANVFIASRAKMPMDAALDLIDRLESDCPDIAIFQSSLACPIDWLTIRLARLPFKAAIHVGCSLFNPGLDVTFFDNPANIERENAFWPESAGARIALPAGADVAALDAQPRLDRERFGIPVEAVIVGTMSNHLDKRMSEPYMSAVAGALKACPQAWFLAFGADAQAEKLEFFGANGVADRVRFGGKQIASGSALKVLDIYANEFPVGGSQSVIEAMACGVPVAALRWSDAHAESSGANAVGPPYAVQGPDIEAYAALLQKWIANPAARAEAGAAMRRRAEQVYDSRVYVAALLDRCAHICGSRDLPAPKRLRQAGARPPK